MPAWRSQAAKTAGRAHLRYFSTDLDEQAYRSLMLESELRQALPRGELEVYYQPQVACSDAGGIGAEALIRWNHPTRVASSRRPSSSRSPRNRA